MSLLNKILFKIFGVRLISSQCGEDLIIESFLPFKKDGFYVDIGAHHPIKYSNTFLFHNKGWKGINIEPNPEKKKLFNFFRGKDVNLNMGIGPIKSEMDFYVFDESTLSTFDESSAKEFKKIGHIVTNVIKVPIFPLKEVLEKYAHNKEIDLMSIDTEGYDMEVLKSNDWKRFRPEFIILETIEYSKDGKGKKLNDVYDKYMSEIGYNKVADTNINTIYRKNN
ncbi:MAG: FkbM family methyltransferase [Patescibacteria group bacterium]